MLLFVIAKVDGTCYAWIKRQLTYHQIWLLRYTQKNIPLIL